MGSCRLGKGVTCLVQAWNLTGDAFTHNPGDKPWISEMYGYSFGTASANVWHHVDYEAMLYPGYTTYGKPLFFLGMSSLSIVWNGRASAFQGHDTS